MRLRSYREFESLSLLVEHWRSQDKARFPFVESDTWGWWLRRLDTAENCWSETPRTFPAGQCGARVWVYLGALRDLGVTGPPRRTIETNS